MTSLLKRFSLQAAISTEEAPFGVSHQRLERRVIRTFRHKPEYSPEVSGKPPWPDDGDSCRDESEEPVFCKTLLLDRPSYSA